MDAEGFPTAIVHFDGDSFFASVEQSLDYTLRGKPVMTGSERGVITSLSVEAKQCGLRRGMSLREIRAICPEAFFVPSNYTAYSIYARRMYRIVRRFTPLVHEYSIDECFADITGLDERSGISYQTLALRIKGALESHLGITFGVGLAPNKLLAKIASKHRKPAGFTAIPLPDIPRFLAELPIGKVWGIGSSMSVALGKLGIRTALDFRDMSIDRLAESGLVKPYRQMWYELQGHCIHGISGEADADDSIGSIMKTRTFSPPSRSRAFVISQLSKNIEHACATARLHGVRARAISFYLKTQEFTYHRIELGLPIATADPSAILEAVMSRFGELYVSGILYRATGITLMHIIRDQDVPHDLFGAVKERNEILPLWQSVDSMNRRYGRSSIFLASSMQALAHRDRAATRTREKPHEPAMHAAYRRKTIDMPFLGIAR
jgi:DNA polymerase-4/DNA polymerase V